MQIDSWSKYDRHKAIGGIYKKGRQKGQREVIKLIKADEEHNFETLANQLNTVINQLKNLSERLTVIEEKLGIIQQTQ